MRLEHVEILSMDFSIPETSLERENGARLRCPYSSEACTPNCPLSVTFSFTNKLTKVPSNFTFCSKNPFVMDYAEKLRKAIEHTLAGIAVEAAADNVFKKDEDAPSPKNRKRPAQGKGEK